MISAILLGAGSGFRFGGPLSKQFIRVGGRSILEHSANALFCSSLVDSFVYVAKSGEETALDSFFDSLSLDYCVATGGVERAHSVLNGLKACRTDTDFVLIHDGVRPNLSPNLVVKLIRDAQKLCVGIVPVVPVVDTLKRFDGEFITSTVNREELVQVQTPQVYPYKMILDAYERGLREGFTGTDDAAYAFRCGIPVKAIQGNSSNLKITSPEDLDLFRYYLSPMENEDS